jgi:hypothetical protein
MVNALNITERTVTAENGEDVNITKTDQGSHVFLSEPVVMGSVVGGLVVAEIDHDQLHLGRTKEGYSGDM